LTNLQLDVIDDLASSIRLAQLDGLELQHTSSFVTAGRSENSNLLLDSMLC
jgi:hypothetical protein